MRSLERILTAACRERDRPWALVTPVRVVGSTYRRPGARLLISPDGTGLGWCVSTYHHPSELPADFVADRQSAAVVMTHNFVRDLAALDRLLPLDPPYLGLLGPKRRHLDLIARLQEIRELEPTWLENLFSPAGLDIGRGAPEEIALAIVSEAAAVLAGRRGGFLRDRISGIHTVSAKEA